MDVIDISKCSYESLASAYMADRLMNYPIKSCREWLRICTNAVELCGCDDEFDKFVQVFECHYLAYAVKLCSLKALKYNPFK